MSKRHEGHFKGSDQNELFYQTWTPDNPRGVVVITHGLAEHSECYHPLAKVLSEDGWQVFAWDMRGHGRSEGKRGFVMGLANFIDDMDRFLDQVMKQSGVKPAHLVMFGHSLGGLTTIRYLQTHQRPYAALALSSPGLGLSIAVPKFKEMLANVAIKWMPTLTLHNEIKYTDLTHDEQMIKSYQTDNLRHDKISPGLFLSMVENFKEAAAAVESIRQPVLMQLCGDDRLVSTAAAREFFEHLPNKKSQLEIYPESFHEIYNDFERDKAIADLKKFINPYAGA